MTSSGRCKSGGQFLVILTDLSAAFDRVNRLSFLFETFSSLDFQDPTLHWFSSLPPWRLLHPPLPAHAVPQHLFVPTNPLGTLLKFHGFKCSPHADDFKCVALSQNSRCLHSAVYSAALLVCLMGISCPKMSSSIPPTLPLVKGHCSKWALHPSICSGKGALLRVKAKVLTTHKSSQDLIPTHPQFSL